MIIVNPGYPWRGRLEPSDCLSVSPSGTTTVKVQHPDGSSAIDTVTTPRRFGPYPHPVAVLVTCLSGECTADSTVVRSPLVGGCWDDLRFPAQGINPAGSAAPPTVDNDSAAYPGSLLFAGNKVNVIGGVAQMPHSWKAGTAIRPHLHWSKPVGSANAVSWVLYYRILGTPGDVHGDLVGPIDGTLVEGDQAVANSMLLTAFGSINMGKQKESTCLLWQVRRLGNSDADNGDARLFEFDIHYQIDKPGSVLEFPQ